MGMEGQIMCMEKCTFWTSSVAFLGPQHAPESLAAGALPNTPLRKLTALPRPLGLRGLLLREEMGGEGAKMIYASGARNPHAATAPTHGRMARLS